MDPLTMGVMGLNLVSGVSGLLGASSAAKRAEQARIAAIRDMMAGLSDEEFGLQQEGSRGLASFTGQLRDSLNQLSGAVGDANSAAGVYGPAAAGVIANQGAAGAQALGQYGSDLSAKLASLRAAGRQRRAELMHGNAMADAASAQAQRAGAIGSLGNILQMLPGFVNPTKPQQITGSQAVQQAGQPAGQGFQTTAINPSLYTMAPKPVTGYMPAAPKLFSKSLFG